MPDKKYLTIDERQSYVMRSGQEWEDKVIDFVNNILKDLDSTLRVIRGKNILRGSKLWSKLSIPVGKSGFERRIWGDIDLVVVDINENPVGVISCKTSLHGRFSETLFYAVVLKNLVKNLKFLFATPDKGRQPKGGKWQSEWGSEEKPTKDRLLGSHYLDGVYVLNPDTKLGGMIKSLDNLPKDIIKFYQQLTDR